MKDLRWRGSAHSRVLTDSDMAAIGFPDEKGFVADRTVEGSDVVSVSDEVAAWLLTNDQGWLDASEEAPPIVEPATSLATFDPVEGEEPSPENYEAMTVEVLQEKIRERNEAQDDEALHMKVSGSKSELVTRLKDNDAATADEGDQQDQ